MPSVDNVIVTGTVGEALNFSYPAVHWDTAGANGKRASVTDRTSVRGGQATWPEGIDGFFGNTPLTVTFDCYSGDNPPGPNGLTTSVIAYIPSGVPLTSNVARKLNGKTGWMSVTEGTDVASGSLTFNLAIPPVPVVAADQIMGIAGYFLSHQLHATNNPSSFSIYPLPDGLSLDTGLGLVSGTPHFPGVTQSKITARNDGGYGTGALTFLIEADELGIPVAGGAFGQLEIFDLSPSRTQRMSNVSVEGGDGGAGAGGVFNEFIYQKNVACATPVISQLTVTQPLPVALEITFADYFTDDVRLRINGTAIQDWQRCGNQVDGIAYYGPMRPGDQVDVDFFAQCAESGRTSNWTAKIFYLSGTSVIADTFHTPPLTDRYFANTGFATFQETYENYGSFTIKDLSDPVAWEGSHASIFTFSETETGNILMRDEAGFAIQGVANGDEYITEGTGTLHHFRPAKEYKTMSFSPTPLNYRFKIAQVEEYVDSLMMETGLKSDEHAWISYDVRSGGFLTQVVQGYAIALIDSLTGNSIKYNDGGSELGGNAPLFTSGFCQQVSAIIYNTGSGCADPDDLPDKLKYCVTGSGAADLATVRSGIIEIMKSFGQDVKITLPDVEDFSSSQVTGSYYHYTGTILFNQPESGDSICFNNYVFDDKKSFVDEYSGAFGHVPPHPDIAFCLNYPQDYQDVYSLAAALNSGLSGNHWVWYPYPCTENQYDGYFENTGIMEFTVADSNTINFKSVLVGPAGKHDWKFNYTGIREITEVSYLLPSTILMQGSFDNQSWTTLHSGYNIDWLGITPTTGTNNYSYFKSGGHTNDPDQKPPKDDGVGVKGVIAIPLGSLTGSGMTKCGTPFTTVFDIEVPIDPSGCPEPDDDDKDKDKNDDDDPNAGGQDPNMPGVVTYSQLKTGWKFENDTAYNYYRIFLDQFSVAPDGSDSSVSGFFAITNINLFGTHSGDNYVTADACVIGADYSVDVQSQTTGLLTGILTGHASARTSGKAIWDHVLVEGIPNGDGIVKFQTEYGRATGLFQALVTAEKVGIGMVSASTGGFYTYDAVDHLFSLPPSISGVVTGCGIISGGPYNIVGKNAQPYPIGGPDLTRILGGLYENVVRTYTFPVTGYIPNVPVPGYNIQAFGYLTGTLNGVVGTEDSGYYQFNTGIEGVPETIYSYVVDSFVNAQAALSYDPVGLAQGDKVIINGQSVTYTTGTQGAPAYFNSLSGLVSIINNDPSGFGIRAHVGTSHISPTYVSLYAAASGAEGNGITLASKGTGNPPIFDSSATYGGVTNYETLDLATNVFKGNINEQVAAVSYFENASAEGYISGFLDYISQIKVFTGIWGLRTGVEDYLSNHWVTSGVIYEKPGNAPVVMFNSPGSISMTVNYLGNANFAAPDVATLRISGVNFPEYIEFNITGYK